MAKSPVVAVRLSPMQITELDKLVGESTIPNTTRSDILRMIVDIGISRYRFLMCSDESRRENKNET